MRGRAFQGARSPIVSGQIFLGLIVLGLFVLPLWLTGAPLVFFGDTATHATQAWQLRDLALAAVGAGPAPEAVGQLSLGRALSYSALFGATQAVWPIWGTPALQGALTLGALGWLGARLAALEGVDSDGRRRGALALCLVAGLSSAPWFVGLLLPDIFAGLGILAAAALMALHDRLGLAARAGLAALALAAAATHDTHLLALAVLTAAAFVPGLAAPGPAGDRGRALRRLRGLMLGVCAGGAALSALNAPILTRIAGEPPVRLPFLGAHLIDMGPGWEHLADNCPDAGYAFCTFDIAPEATWEEILFSRTPGLGVYNLADPETRRALGDEQVRFALAVFADRPGATAAGLAADALRQLTRFSLDSLDPKLSDWDRYVGRLPARLRDRYGPDHAFSAEPGRAAALLDPASVWIAAGALAAAAALIAAAVRLAPQALAGADPAAARRLRLAGLLVAGVIFNGLICGMLASPYDRFQARVIWLVPVAAAVALAALPVRRRAVADGGALAETQSPSWRKDIAR